MPSVTSPHRNRRCLASLIAFGLAVTLAPEQAIAQVDEPPVSFPAVVVVAPDSFPVRSIERDWDAETADESATTAAADRSFDTRKARISFSPVELTPIRPPAEPTPAVLPPATTSPDPWEAKRDEIDQRALARIFSGGMIVDADPSPVQPAVTAQAVVAQTPPSLIEADNFGPMIEVLNDGPLAEPPLVSDILGNAEQPLPPMPTEMATPRPESLPPTDAEMQSHTFALPDGGLDVWLLAPSRFSRPLPHAR